MAEGLTMDISQYTDKQLIAEIELRILIKTDRIEYLTEALNNEYNK